jgi:peptide subunit release factor 1 (eRF1)
MRMMLPFTMHERNLDRAVLEALRELRRDLDGERARGARARVRLRRLEEVLTRAKDSGRT